MIKFKKNTDDRPLLIGRHPIVEAIREGITLDKVMMLDSMRGEFEREMRQLCKQFSIPLQVVPKDKMQRISTANHQGVIGIRAHIDYHQLDNLLPIVYEKGEDPLILILDSITDIRNFGAIARSAELSGVHAIVVPMKDAAPINGEAIKTSAGALTRIPVCRSTSLVTTVRDLQNSGIVVVVADHNSDAFIYDVDFRQPTAIIMGAEGEGVSPSLINLANHRVKIPQVGNMESFNVSVATGIILYEIMRQKLHSVG
ncbi:MAG: 23S rRNA (guanosine(2251)-2'-O)-methyltransferase RlmB [Saprospiraceae bacterium]|nr:23S rRNA (guanosine(2251)-2'-O)-methyltransferase RlmB [Saprospiraceae bacterium]